MLASDSSSRWNAPDPLRPHAWIWRNATLSCGEAARRSLSLPYRTRGLGSEAWVDGLALHREDAEHALVHSVERLVPNESLRRLDAESELTDRKRALASEAAGSQAIDLAGVGVLGAVDDAQVLAASAFDARLNEAFAPLGDEAHRLDDHALAAGRGQLLPPRRASCLILDVGDIDGVAAGRLKPVGIGRDEPVAVLEVPGVVAGR